MDVLAGVPVDPEKRRGIPYAPPNLDQYVVRKCPCGTEIYVGPTMLSRVERTGETVWCTDCVMANMVGPLKLRKLAN